MATTQLPLSAPSNAILFRETDLTSTKVAVKASSGTLYGIVVDNSSNGSASYLKLFNVASGSVTVGTTAPDWVFLVPASVKRTFIFPEGVAFGTALTAACVTAGGTAGTTDPTENVAVDIIYA